MKKKEATQWEDMPPGAHPHAVTIFAPDADIESTLMGERGLRADCVVAGMASSACPVENNGKENRAEAYRVGFLVTVNAGALGTDMEAKAFPPMIAELVEHFHAAMRMMFGVDAVNEAGEILQEEKRRRREAAMNEFIQMVRESDMHNN